MRRTAWRASHGFLRRLCTVTHGSSLQGSISQLINRAEQLNATTSAIEVRRIEHELNELDEQSRAVMETQQYTVQEASGAFYKILHRKQKIGRQPVVQRALEQLSTAVLHRFNEFDSPHQAINFLSSVIRSGVSTVEVKPLILEFGSEEHAGEDQRIISDLNPQTLAQLAWCSAKSFIADPGWYRLLGRTVLHMGVESFTNHQLSLLAWSFGKSKFKHSVFLRETAAIVAERLQHSTAEEPRTISTLALGISYVGGSYPEMNRELMRHVLLQREAFSVRELTTTVYALTRIGCRSHDFVHACFDAIYQKRASLSITDRETIKRCMSATDIFHVELLQFVNSTRR